MKKVFLAVALSGALLATDAMAQESLSEIIPQLFGANGLIVNSDKTLPNGQTHSAHFNSSFQQSFTPFNSALASQLAAIPLPSPASSFTYTLDPSLGVFKRSTQSFGPILSDRSETIGKHKASLGFSFQHFKFNSIDGTDLSDVPVVFTHDNPAAGTGRDDLVTTVNSIQASVSQFTAFLNYGLIDRIDLSVAVPMVNVDLTASSVATIQRIGTVDPAIHYFKDPSAAGGYGSQAKFTSSGSKTGIGDVIFRLKANVLRQAGTGVAVGAELRLPTGDEKNLLGSGATGVEGFLIFSSTHKFFSPHLKMAYQWNGKSILAGDVTTGVKGDLPDQFFYEMGADIAVAKRMTLALDFLGRSVINGEKLVPYTFDALNGRSTFPSVQFETASFNVANGSVGVKINPAGNLLVDFNVLFKLNNNGLRSDVAPLVGIEYGF